MRPRLYLHVLGLETRKLMSYRVDFWISAGVSFGVQLLLMHFLWTAVFAATGAEAVGGRRFEDLMAYGLLVILLGKIVWGFDVEGGLSQEIYDGAYTRYLVYPANYPAFKYAQQLGTLLPALVQLALFGALAPLLVPVEGFRITASSLAMGAGALALGHLLHFLLVYPVQAVAFWADNVWSLMVMVRMSAHLLGGYLLPLDLYPAWAQEALAWLPFRFLFYVPAQALLGGMGWSDWAREMSLGAGWCLALAAFGRAVWRRGDMRYTGVGI